MMKHRKVIQGGAACERKAVKTSALNAGAAVNPGGASDGTLDPTFNVDGSVQIVNAVGDVSDGPYGMTLQDDNKILIFSDGDHNGSFVRDTAILRLDTNGSADTSFDLYSFINDANDTANDGILVNTSLSGASADIKTLSDGSIIIVKANKLQKKVYIQEFLNKYYYEYKKL